MKLQNLFIAILFIGILFSCSSDDDNDSGDSGTVIGTWTMVEMEANGATTYQGLPVTIVGEGANFDGTTVFTENPNEVVSNATFDLNIEIKLVGQTIAEENYGNDDSAEKTSTWSLDGDQLTITDSNTGESQTVSIEFSNNGNTITFEKTQLVEYNGVSVDIDVKVVYTK